MIVNHLANNALNLPEYSLTMEIFCSVVENIFACNLSNLAARDSTLDYLYSEGGEERGNKIFYISKKLSL